MKAKLIIFLFGMGLCGCESFQMPNIDWGNLWLPPANRPFNSPIHTIPKAKAEAGDPVAQYDLAVGYQLGQGVERDDVAAHKWYAIAAANSGAEESLKAKIHFHQATLDKRMTPEQIAEAESAAEDYLTPPAEE